MTERSFTVDLPMPPSVWRLYRGTGKRRHRSPEYRKWIGDAGWTLIEQRNRQCGRACLDGKVEVDIHACRNEGKRSAAVPVNGGEPAGEGKRSAAVPQERRGNPPGASIATPCPEGRQSRPVTAGKPAGGGKKRDLDNILKALLDLLTSTRTIGDDSQVVAIDARWVDDGPACRMTVRAVGPGGCRS